MSPLLLRACARTSARWSILPDDLFAHLVLHFLTAAERANLVRACFPRAVIVSRWSHGRRDEFALGMQPKPVHDGSMQLEHFVCLRGRLFRVGIETRAVGVFHDPRRELDVIQDWQELGRLFCAIRGRIRALDKKRCSADFYRRLSGFRSLESWHRVFVDLSYGGMLEK
jgi:hypothetical protein